MADEHRGLPFLKRRYARAIECGDDETAARLRLELDLLMNGPLARLEADGAGNRPSRHADGRDGGGWRRRELGRRGPGSPGRRVAGRAAEREHAPS
jgi:hypothetical protein